MPSVARPGGAGISGKIFNLFWEEVAGFLGTFSPH
jgi:hypothetical protein